MDTTTKKRKTIKGKRTIQPRAKSGTFQDSAYSTPEQRKLILAGAEAIEPKLSLSSMFVVGALELAKRRIREAEKQR